MSDILDKAFSFFKTAIKKYDEGNIDEALSDIDWGCEALEDYEPDDHTISDDTEVVGENYNFGKTYNVLKENSEKLYQTKSGRRTLVNAIKLIKENELLKTQFDVYKAFEGMSSNVDIDTYLNEAIQYVPELNKGELQRANEKLYNVLKEGNVDFNVKINDGLKNLYESIEFIMTNSKNIRNIDRFQLAENVIKEHIQNNISNNQSSRRENIDEVYNKNIKMFESKYNNELTDAEIKFLSEMTKPDVNHKEYFNKKKDDLLKQLKKTINESDNDDDRSSWNTIYETIDNLEFNKNTVIEQIAKIIEVENKLND